MLDTPSQHPNSKDRSDIMARIFIGGYDLAQKLVTNVETNKNSFYQSIINLLAKAGNDVLCIDCTWGSGKKIPQQVITKITNFEPDLCLIFNYGFWDLSDYVDCSFAYCDIDAIDDISLATNYLIRNKVDRSIFIVTDEMSYHKVIDSFGVDESKVKLINIPVKVSDKEHVNKNKSYEFLYIGTNTTNNSYKEYADLLAKSQSKADVKDARSVLDKIESNPTATIFEEYDSMQSYANIRLKNESTKSIVIDNFAISKLQMLSAISHLNLTIKGSGWNSAALHYYPEVLKCVGSLEPFDVSRYSSECSRAKFTIWFNDGPFKKGSYLRLLEAINSDTIVIAQECELSEKLIKEFNLLHFKTKDELVKLCEKLAKGNVPNKDEAKTKSLLEKNYNGKDFLRHIEEYLDTKFSNEEKEPTILLENDFVEQTPAVNQADSSQHSAANHNDVVVQQAEPPVVKRGLKYFIKKTVKRTLLFFGYDVKNNYRKYALKLFGFILFENLHYSETIDRIYILSLPIIEIRKNSKSFNVHLSFFTQIWENLKKLGKFFRQRRENKSVSSDYQKKNKAIYAKLRKKIRKGEKIKICLFVSRISCWIYTYLYKCLNESNLFDVTVVVKPFMFNGHDAMINYMNTTYEALKASGYKVVKGFDEITGEYLNVRKAINPDIVFYTKYWLPQFHKNFYINNFEDKLTFYTSYCYDIAYHPEVMNFELNNKVDRYFMPTQVHKEMAKIAMNNHARNVYVVGAPKLDVFFDKSYEPKDVWKPQNGKKKKRIIWAPHHSDNFPGDLYQFNAFYELTEFMFEMAEKYKDEIQIAFKPHPMLFPYLANKKWGKDSAESYYNRWANLENGQLETGEFIDLFLTSDAMILDSISFIAEYTATNKPSLFTIGPTSRVQLNEFGGINFDVLYHTRGDSLKTDIERFIVDVVIKGKDTKKDERTRFVNKYLLPPNGKTSAENIFDNIIDEINNGDKNK